MTCKDVGNEMICYEPINAMWWDDVCVNVLMMSVCDCVGDRCVNLLMMGV